MDTNMIIYVGQACSNIQEYIVKKATGWLDQEYDDMFGLKCAQSYGKFKKRYPQYEYLVSELEQEFGIHNLSDVITQMKKDIAYFNHPDIDTEILVQYCDKLNEKYHGVTAIGRNYHKIDTTMLDDYIF